jgi:sortase A
MKKPPKNNLRKLNNSLTVLAAIMALYLIFMPFLPNFWWWSSHVFRQPNLSVIQVTKNQPTNSPSQLIPEGNWLDVPRINLHEQIYTGLSIDDLNKGAWHIPGTSTPDKGSNTVLAGHRFLYYFKPSGVFYNLDKIQKDDRVTVDWQGVEYTYKVSDIKVVAPTDVSIQAPTTSPRFTLYTCTPLWTAKQRLVIQSELVAKRPS